MVSVKGAMGNVSTSQTSLRFEDDLQYKSITFLTGENNLPYSWLNFPNAAQSNFTKTLIPSILSIAEPLQFKETTDLFILTFSGNPSDSVTLIMDDFDMTYCTIDGKDIAPTEKEELTVYASEKTNEGKTATVNIIMDKVTDFSAGDSSDYKSSGIELKITSKKNNRYVIYTVLNNILISKGGHYDGTKSIPTFMVTNTLLAEDTYTVELTGAGYIGYKKACVTFDEALTVTNADLVPGDINNDGNVDSYDKEIFDQLIDTTEYLESADFNRDEKVDIFDAAVFDFLKEQTSAPAKMSAPTLKGGSKKITVSWTKPEDNGA